MDFSEIVQSLEDEFKENDTLENKLSEKIKEFKSLDSKTHIHYEPKKEEPEDKVLDYLAESEYKITNFHNNNQKADYNNVSVNRIEHDEWKAEIKPVLDKEIMSNMYGVGIGFNKIIDGSQFTYWLLFNDALSGVYHRLGV